MRRVVVLAVIAAVIFALAGFALAQDELAGGIVFTPLSTRGIPGIPHTFVHIYIPPDGVNPAIPAGENPGSIACIYGLTKRVKGCPKSLTAVPAGGKFGIAVVEAGSNSTLQADAAKFATQWGLPAPNITEVCDKGKGNCGSSNGTGWDVETALDVQWAHAMAPNAHIYVYEFNISTGDPLADGAETQAAKAVAALGGGEVSNSWGYNGGENWCGSAGCELAYDSYFVNPNVVFFASAGDSGAIPQYPSVSPNVVSAGGTFISRNVSGLYTKEYCWNGSGGGESAYEPIPSYQNVISKIVGTHRGTPDIAADASPSSGVAIYNSTYCGGWCTVGGTSVASPVLAGITNAAGGFVASTSDELTKVYGEYGNATQYKALFHDIIGGTNGHGAVKGWDYCTGVGTPKSPKGE